MTEVSANAMFAALMTGRWAADGCFPLTSPDFLLLTRWMAEQGVSMEELLVAETTLPGCPITDERRIELVNRGLGITSKLEKWASAGIRLIGLGDTEYSESFVHLEDRAPALIFAVGELHSLHSSALAILGSRNASEERLALANEIGRQCANAKIRVVSGGARGIDSAGVAGVIEEGHNAVVVVADSLLRESGKLHYRRAIYEEQLCLISEVHPEAGFDVGTAMARNRLCYALSDAAVIIECEPGKGGTRAGVLQALKAGHAVFVVAGTLAEDELRRAGATIVSLDEAMNPCELIRRAKECVRGEPKTKIISKTRERNKVMTNPTPSLFQLGDPSSATERD